MNNQVSFDSLLRMAVRETYMDQVNAIPPEDELEKILHTDDNFKNKIKAIVQKENRNEKLICFSKAVSKVAVVILVCISLTFASLLTADAVRESVATTILEWHDKFTRIFIQTDVQPTELPEIRFNYIPEGFELVEKESFRKHDYYIYTYINDNGQVLQIIVTSYLKSSVEKSDNEHSEFYSVKIGDTYGMWALKGEENQLIIFDTYFYNIKGIIKFEEIINIYRNIEIL